MDDWYTPRACHLCPWTEIERDLHDDGPHDHSRHFDFGARGGFIAPLDLPGWGWQSYWGMSDHEVGFFAALWHKRRLSPVPNYALVSGRRYYKYPGCLTLQIVEITGLSSLKVVRAMAIADPQATLRDDEELAAALDAEPPPDGAAEFARGAADAVRWLLGTNRRAPGSQKRWPRSRPSPEQADAESHMLMGRAFDRVIGDIYDPDRFEREVYYGGAESALWWALGREDELYPSLANPSEGDDAPDE